VDKTNAAGVFAILISVAQLTQKKNTKSIAVPQIWSKTGQQ